MDTLFTSTSVPSDPISLNDFPSWATHYGDLWPSFCLGSRVETDAGLTDPIPFLPRRYLPLIRDSCRIGEIIFLGDFWTILTPDRRWIYCEYLDHRCFIVPHSIVMALGIRFFLQHFPPAMGIPALLELDPYMGEYFSICNNELMPFPTEDREDDFIPEDQVDADQSDDIGQDFDEIDPELAREWYIHKDSHNDGKMLFKDDGQTAVIIYTPEKQWIEFDPDVLLPRYYIKKRGFRYYRRIAADFDIPIRVMITPLEMINLATMNITLLAVECDDDNGGVQESKSV